MAIVRTVSGGTAIVHGKTIYGAWDHKGNEIDLTKRELAYDELTDMVDSEFSSKIVEALSAKLNAEELERVLSILKDASIISEEEMRAATEEPNYAADAQFPHANRLKTRGCGADARGALSGVKTFGMDRIQHDPYPSELPYNVGSNLRPPDNAAWLAKHFPHQDRLK